MYFPVSCFIASMATTATSKINQSLVESGSGEEEKYGLTTDFLLFIRDEVVSVCMCAIRFFGALGVFMLMADRSIEAAAAAAAAAAKE